MSDKKIIPSIALGTWEIPNDELTQLIPEAIRIGYRHFDTAKKYHNEKGVGEGIRNSEVDRKDIFVTSKLWITDFLRTKNAFQASLERLRMDYVDLYLVHWPFSFWPIAWKEMEKIYQSGQAKNIGVSNFGIKELELIQKRHQIKPFVNQIELSPFYYKKDLVRYCQENKILIEAYSPLTRGYRLNDPKIKVIADKHHKTIPQIYLAWALHHNFIVLPKTTSIIHLKENFEAQKIVLTQSDMEYLDSLNEDYSSLSTFWSKK